MCELYAQEFPEKLKKIKHPKSESFYYTNYMYNYYATAPYEVIQWFSWSNINRSFNYHIEYNGRLCFSLIQLNVQVYNSFNC